MFRDLDELADFLKTIEIFTIEKFDTRYFSKAYNIYIKPLNFSLKNYEKSDFRGNTMKFCDVIIYNAYDWLPVPKVISDKSLKMDEVSNEMVWIDTVSLEIDYFKTILSENDKNEYRTLCNNALNDYKLKIKQLSMKRRLSKIETDFV